MPPEQFHGAVGVRMSAPTQTEQRLARAGARRVLVADHTRFVTKCREPEERQPVRATT